MRITRYILLTLVLGAWAPSLALAQKRGPIEIQQVRVGYLFNEVKPLYKPGGWTPVYVTVQAGQEGFPRGEMVVESSDSDDVRNRYRVTMPPLEPNEIAVIMGYTRPGSAGNEVAVSIRIPDKNQTVATAQDHAGGVVDFEERLFLTVGSRLQQLRRTLNPRQPTGDDESNTDDRGPYHTAVIEDIRLLPNQWFVYEPLDLVILSTGNRDFLTALLNEREGRKEALLEWVRRGGRLLVTVSRNQDLVAKLEPIAGALPVTITGTEQFPVLNCVQSFANLNVPGLRSKAPIEVAKLESKLGREGLVFLSETRGDANVPVGVAGSYGLGRIWVVGLDLDVPPFLAWNAEAQRAFWKKLLEMTGNKIDQQLVDTAVQQPMRYSPNTENTLAGQLERSLEDFEDVPVISFGWVALFILLYILLVGPLDYFFLKKVVKRLELTWITFPTVVITISVVAYFTAYWVKGNDQKISKIDIVDIDLHTGQLYGSSMFTIFSPRIQHYTIGIEPASPGWGTPGAAGTNAGTMLTWMGRPEVGWGGGGRSSQGLFRRAYEYAPQATGLQGVPIQVWSTKSFRAAWECPLDPGNPLIRADLRHPSANSSTISGTIISNLPVPLEDVVISVPGSNRSWASLDRLEPGVARRVDNAVGARLTGVGEWVSRASGDAKAENVNPRRTGTAAVQAVGPLVKRMMFYVPGGDNYRNTSLQAYDQIWRLSHKDEVILVGRIPRTEGPAEDVLSSPASPSKLWLGELPGGGAPRPPLPGTLAQETWVRVIVPVRSATAQ